MYYVRLILEGMWYFIKYVITLQRDRNLSSCYTTHSHMSTESLYNKIVQMQRWLEAVLIPKVGESVISVLYVARCNSDEKRGFPGRDS